MTQAEFATLCDNTWLTDAVLTFFLKTFVHDEAKGVHCFSSGFFKLIEHRNGGVYNYEESVENVVRATNSMGMRRALPLSNNC